MSATSRSRIKRAYVARALLRDTLNGDDGDTFAGDGRAT
jgi:hypothetical protein